jgi:predicted transcriptional regulator
MDFEELGWVKASEYRKKILNGLKEKPQTPKDLSDRSNYYLSHVSKTLKELEKHELAECVTPDRKKGRIYKITKKGEKIQRQINA